MKKILALLASVIALQTWSAQDATAHSRPSHGGISVSFGVFYNDLSPYGDWISVGGGVYGWRPVGVAVGWRPYTVGRWVWTDDGWYWFSDEPWGWATFHYGRWHYDDYYGWVWIPGYDWAPAWVEWRYGGGYVGWAPLSPYAVFSISWGIHYRTRWYTPAHWWNFIDCGHITHHNVHRYVYRDNDNTRYIGRTRGGGSVRYDGGRIRSRGPEADYVEREGKVRVAPVRIHDVDDRPVERLRNEGGRERIEVYRPRIEEGGKGNADAIRPGRVREDRGRTIDLDTRSIDVRSNEVERKGGRDLDRTDEYRTRDGVAPGTREEDAIDRTRERESQQAREAAGRIRETERERIRQPEQPRETPNVDRQRMRTEEGRNREAQPQVRPEPRERRREEGAERPVRQNESVERARRPDAGSTPRMAMPRNEQPRSSGSGRNEGGRRR